MPVVFVVASDWTLRTAIRAELRELGFEALGMEAADEVGRALASGEMPSAVVLEGTAQLAGDPAIGKLVEAVPTVLVGSRTERLELPRVVAVFYRPVRVRELIAKVRELVQKGQAA